MNTIERKIAFSFAILSLTFLVMMLVIYVQISHVTESTQRIQNVLEPSLKANLRMTVALKTTLTSQQSWILLKKPIFKRQRLAAWSVIDKMYKQLLNYSKYWENATQIEELKSLGMKLALLKQQQQTIESHFLGQKHALALTIFHQKSLPLSQNLIESLRHIYDPQNWEMERIFVLEEKLEKRLQNSALLFATITVIGSLTIGFLLGRAVIMPLIRTVELADSITQGNYSPHSQSLSGEKRLDTALLSMLNQLSSKEQENYQQQQTLNQYNQELKASNEELSQFSYRTSHDLRAPLITIRRLAELISEDINEQNYSEALKNGKKIAFHVKKLENLVVDILDLAKAELEISDNEDLVLYHVLEDIEQRLQHIYLENNVSIQYEKDESARFHVSRIRLTQVLENLISNGIKYADVTKASAYVRITHGRSENNYPCIVVEDNGIGIPTQFHQIIFGMFQRFHPEVSYGSGLGMYIINKHILKMDCEINFTSSEKGTKFIIEFT